MHAEIHDKLRAYDKIARASWVFGYNFVKQGALLDFS